ncbi:unnamed protein product [Microthlaspi erraticum]|uniref:FBD domain-containing protein n=1 Tax=Microthlaspi erraticum TaxID=1685480 RepID=A0A6D2L9S0_9BRAS|nr:unnamed protein product [Microthlaspi erraticum]
MDRISPLHDELLLKILSFLPTTKDVMATMVLSKRWQPLWMMVPRLVYDDTSYQNVGYGSFRRFVDRSLLFHKAPALETLRFKVTQTSGVGDIPLWTRAAEKHALRELYIEIHSSSIASPAVLPRSLYAGCRMLVIFVDAASPISFPILKILELKSVKYPGDEFVKRFLSNCPVLEDLVVEQCPGDNVTVFTVRVPSLESLYLEKSPDRDMNDAEGFVIDAPSLKYLGITDTIGGFCVIENEMPNIVKAKVEADYKCVSNILGSITSVKCLHLCLRYSKDVYPVGSVFHRLVHLKICTCEPEWLNVFIPLLRNSPKLKYLKLKQSHTAPDRPHPCWIEPNSIPECLLTSLETLEWDNYEGAEEDKEVATFILRNGNCLKNVAVFSSTSIDSDEKLEMIKDLSYWPRRSPACYLTFD